MNNRREQSIAASVINILAGVWLLISVGIYSPISPVQSANFTILAILVIAVALIRLFSPMRTGGLSWANVIFGAWLIISPFILGFINAAVMWNSIILGVIIGATALWNRSVANVKMTHASEDKRR